MRKIKPHTKKVIYIALGILAFAILYALKNTSYFMRAFGFILSIFVFFAADQFFNFDFKKHHYLIFIFISTAGVLLSPLYSLYPNYDKILHLCSPILFSILIFFLVDKLKVKFSIKLILTLAVVISVLAFFEIGEYLLEELFDLKLQGVYIRDYSRIEKLKLIQGRNEDTMIDLILGTIGSLMFVAIKTAEFHYKRLNGKLKRKNN